MGDVFVWIASNWQVLVGTAGAVVMGASLMVKAIAPYTATDVDDNVVTWLDKAHSWLSAIALNPPLKK